MITIFTPTYNRGYLLKNIYNCLLNQTDLNFLWLIIDDGSNDNTKLIVKEFEKENKINIKYIYQENQGKHIATNNALKYCKTKYMLCLDSDDTLSFRAVEILNSLCSYFNNEIWGIVGPRANKENKLTSNWNVKNFSSIKFQDIYQKYNYIGETYILLDVQKALNFIFPKFKNENFAPENILYYRLDDLYNVITLNKKIYIYEYLENGLTRGGSKLFLKNLQGYAYSNYVTATCRYSSFINKVKSYARFLAIKIVFKIKIDKKLLNKKVPIYVKIFSICILPLYIIRYLIKHLKYKNEKESD